MTEMTEEEDRENMYLALINLAVGVQTLAEAIGMMSLTPVAARRLERAKEFINSACVRLGAVDDEPPPTAKREPLTGGTQGAMSGMPVGASASIIRIAQEWRLWLGALFMLSACVFLVWRWLIRRKP